MPETVIAILCNWYDGYAFGGMRVYCPWDVTDHADALIHDGDALPRNYWKNTSENGVIRDFVAHEGFDVAEAFETLMNGGTLRREISDELTYDSLYETEDNLWSVLLMTGYLTKANPKEVGNEVDLRIPNAEIATIFEDTVVSLFRETIDRGRQDRLMGSLWRGDAEEATRILSDLLWETISFNDYQEDYYHTFLTGIFVGLGYSVSSNREQGLGRAAWSGTAGRQWTRLRRVATTGSSGGTRPSWRTGLPSSRRARW